MPSADRGGERGQSGATVGSEVAGVLVKIELGLRPAVASGQFGNSLLPGRSRDLSPVRIGADIGGRTPHIRHLSFPPSNLLLS